MKTKSLSVVFSLLCSNAPLAAEHLTPYVGVFADYLYDYDEPFFGDSKIPREIFHEGYKADIRARVAIFPSFDSESLVAVRHREDGTYGILTVKLRKTLQLYKHPRDGKTDRCETSISSYLANRILNAWEAILLQTRFPDIPVNKDGSRTVTITADGEHYHFSMRARDGNVIAGQTHSPPEETPPGKLVSVAWAMADACHHKTQKYLEILENRVDDLETALNEEKH